MKYIKKFEKKIKYTIDGLIDAISYLIDDMTKIKKILNSDININTYGNRKYLPFHMATYVCTQTGNTELLDLLLNCGADINGINTAFGDSALMQTANNYNHAESPYSKKIIFYLIEHNADLNITNLDDQDFFNIIEKREQQLHDDIIKKYPEKYKEYLIKKVAKKYNL